MPERPDQHAKTQTLADAKPISCLAAIVSSTSRLGADVVSASLTKQLTSSVELQIHSVYSSSEATAAAEHASRTADVVVAVGGDGTVADVATGIFGSGVALGILPAGSTNITARSLGIPGDPVDALSLLSRQPELRLIDVGRSGDRSFLHIAGAGFDAELFNAANSDWKRRVGWVAYLPAAASAIALPPSEIRVIADAEEITARSSLVLVANGGAAITPGFRIYPGISVEDGWLDVLVFTSATPMEIAATLWHAGMQRLDRSPHVIQRRARCVRIEAVPPLSVELDGDPRGHTPREFHVVPRGLSVIVQKPEG